MTAARIGAYALCAAAAFAGCGGSVDALSPADSEAPSVSPQAVSAPNVEGSSPGAPAVFVIDSTNTLYSFDLDGNPLQKLQFNSAIGNLNGGITAAMGKVYVTWVKHAGNGVGGGVFAFDAATLKQVRLHIGAFAVAADDPGERYGIAFDPHNAQFYVATARSGLLAFDRLGKYIPRTAQAQASVSAVAYDSTSNSLWAVLNRSVVRFDEEHGAPLPGLPATAIAYRHGFGAVTVAYCANGSDGAGPLQAIAVAFGKTKPGAGGGAGRTYDTSGKPIGSRYAAKILNPHGMSCSSRGDVFIAADNGLLEFSFQGAALAAAPYSQKLTPPIYGVLAAY